MNKYIFPLQKIVDMLAFTSQETQQFLNIYTGEEIYSVVLSNIVKHHQKLFEHDAV